MDQHACTASGPGFLILSVRKSFPSISMAIQGRQCLRKKKFCKKFKFRTSCLSANLQKTFILSSTFCYFQLIRIAHKTLQDTSSIALINNNNIYWLIVLDISQSTQKTLQPPHSPLS